MLISLAPALTMGLLAFAAAGPQAAAWGIPAALLSSAVGGLVFALLSRGPMPAGGPSAATVLVIGALVAAVMGDPAFSAADPAAVAALLALVAMAVVTMGVGQMALGLAGLAGFAKYVPQPVLAGFMNGVALLALIALLPLLVGWPVGAVWAGGAPAWDALAQIQPVTLMVGLFTVAIILGLPRLAPRLPATLIGLMAGSGAYALMHVALPGVEMGPLTGAMPTAWPRLDLLASLFDAGSLVQQHALAALSAGGVMALIGTLDLVLNSLAIDQACHRRTDPKREVLALGAANVASGLVGGLPVMLLRPRALHMLQVGGRSRAGPFICAGLFAVLGLFAVPLLSLLPQVVLGGVMVTIAFLMADRWSLKLLVQGWYGPRTADLLLALAVMGVVCTVTVVFGFTTAIAVGALLSVGVFIRTMNRSLVRSQCTGVQWPSRRIYLPADEARLHALRARITVLELEGALFFGSADRVAAIAEGLPADCHTLVLDFRRVSLIDASGAVVLAQLSRRLDDRGIVLTLAGVGIDNRQGRMLSHFAGSDFAARHGAADIDQAVEGAELSLLAQEGIDPLRQTVALDDVGLMADLDEAQRARLRACLQSRRLEAGERLFQWGDPGDRLYVITSGSIDVFSANAGDGTQRQRFVSLSPGMMLGEVALLDGQGRTGEAVAVGPTEVHALDADTLRRLHSEDPKMCPQLYRNIALHLSQRLRAAASAWRSSLG